MVSSPQEVETHISPLRWPHLIAWTLADLGRQVRQAVFSKPEVPGFAHSVLGIVPRMTWELHLLLLLGLGLRSQEALPPPCER